MFAEIEEEECLCLIICDKQRNAAQAKSEMTSLYFFISRPLPVEPVIVETFEGFIRPDIGRKLETKKNKLTLSLR